MASQLVIFGGQDWVHIQTCLFDDLTGMLSCFTIVSKRLIKNNESLVALTVIVGKWNRLCPFTDECILNSTGLE